LDGKINKSDNGEDADDSADDGFEAGGRRTVFVGFDTGTGDVVSDGVDDFHLRSDYFRI